MLASGKAWKVTFYLSEGARQHGIPIYSSVLDYLYKSGIAGATVMKGVAGFGAQHRMHAANLLDISDHLPVVVKFIDTQEKIEAILPELETRIGSGLIEIEETTVRVPVRDPYEPAH